MNLDMTWIELARASGGGLAWGAPDDRIDSISTDTRRLGERDAFWALKGANFDGHSFLSEALAERSPGWIIESNRWAEGLRRPAHMVEVPNTQKALQALAAAHRRRFDLPIVAVTGSNGKTTTKEMLRRVCALVGPTCANAGNLNNQLGLPLSLLDLNASHRYGVFEMGASHPGDIAELARIAQPTLAVLTNIGAAHLEYFGSLENTFRVKTELIEFLPKDGRVVYNIDDPLLAALETRLGPRGVSFGANPRAKIRFDADGLIIDRLRFPLALKAFGNLSRYNAAAAAAAAWALGIGAETVRKGLESYEPADMRLERRSHPLGAELLIDAYNANPSSMRAAIEGFCETYRARKMVLVLGDMKELGAQSARLHAELGAWLAELPVSAVYLAGPEMKAAADALAARRPSFAVHYGGAPADWTAELRRELASGNALFFKASRAMALEKAIGAL